MPNGDRANAARATVLELDQPESSLDVDLAAAVRAGVRAVRVTRAVRLSADEPRSTLAFVRLLREAVSDGVPVTWQGQIDTGVDAGMLVHLPPPEPAAGEPVDSDVAQWRQRYQPGLCYYRLGPGFVLVKDVRRPGAAARFRLEGKVDAFRTLEAVVDVNSLDPVTVGVLEDLEREALALRLRGLTTLLPSRMRRWPVPALEV